MECKNRDCPWNTYQIDGETNECTGAITLKTETAYLTRPKLWGIFASRDDSTIRAQITKNAVSKAAEIRLGLTQCGKNDYALKNAISKFEKAAGIA